MDVSNRDLSGEPGGQELIETVASLTGLPAPVMEGELKSILEQSGQSVASLTLDELRTALAAHLERLMHEEMLDSFSQADK